MELILSLITTRSNISILIIINSNNISNSLFEIVTKGLGKDWRNLNLEEESRPSRPQHC